MSARALAVIDIQNDITKHYKDIIDRLNAAVEWAAENGMETVCIIRRRLMKCSDTMRTKTVSQSRWLRIKGRHHES